MNEAVLEFLESTQETLSEIEKQSVLIKEGEIPPSLLNGALANYQGLNAFLIRQYEISVLEDEQLKDEYKMIYSKWFVDTRNKLNDSRISSKFASATEIEANALIDNREEYLSWKRKLNLSERKVSMYRRLLDGFKIQAQMLINISNNMRSELSALSVENRANRNLNKEKIIRKIKQPRHSEEENDDFDNE
ncbi:MAG: hypothetical protein AB7V16_11865 [Vulcanibacillus sp.]